MKNKIQSKEDYIKADPVFSKSVVEALDKPFDVYKLDQLEKRIELLSDFRDLLKHLNSLED